MADLRLDTFDACEPLGFMASVGLLELLSDLLPTEKPRLRFDPVDGTAVVSTPSLDDVDALASLLTGHLVAVAGSGNALGVGSEPYGDPYSGGGAGDVAAAAEVRARLASGIQTEREWARALASDVRLRSAKKESTSVKDSDRSLALMTLRQSTLSKRTKRLVEAMVGPLSEPSTMVRWLTASPLVRCRAAGKAPMASSGWDRSATGNVVLNPVPPPVALVHEWLAVCASPCFPMESDGVSAKTAGWYQLDGGHRPWFIWSLWQPPLSRVAVRHLLSSGLAVAIQPSKLPALRVWPHHHIHAVWASKKTVVRRGGAAVQNDPFLDTPVPLQLVRRQRRALR